MATIVHTQITIVKGGDKLEEILAGNIILKTANTPATVGGLLQNIRALVDAKADFASVGEYKIDLALTEYTEVTLCDFEGNYPIGGRLGGRPDDKLSDGCTLFVQSGVEDLGSMSLFIKGEKMMCNPCGSTPLPWFVALDGRGTVRATASQLKNHNTFQIF